MTLLTSFFLLVIYNISADFDLDFLALYSCAGLWNSFFLLLYSTFGLSQIMKWSTRYIGLQVLLYLIPTKI